jgi:hypothetical protein
LAGIRDERIVPPVRASLLLLLPVVLLTLGCGGACADRNGSYRMETVKRSGTCGEGVVSVVKLSGRPSAPAAPCTGRITYSANNCSSRDDVVCPKAGVNTHIDEAVDWDFNGLVGAGTVTLSRDGPDSCSGTYDVGYGKI